MISINSYDFLNERINKNPVLNHSQRYYNLTAKMSAPTLNSAEKNGKLLLLFIPSKTAILVPELTVEDLPLGRTAVLVPEFAFWSGD